MTDEVQIDLYQLMIKMVDFPKGEVCTHYVALQLLSLMEKHGVPVSETLAHSLTSGSTGDEESLEEINTLLGNLMREFIKNNVEFDWSKDGS